VIDGGLDRLHEVIAAKLDGHSVLAELMEEAEAAGGTGGVSDLTRQRMELEIAAAARKDDTFGQAVRELVDRLRGAGQPAGSPVIAGPGSATFTGNARVVAVGGGIAIGQAASVNIGQGPPDPQEPGGDSH
jgi:hypothetical protein